MKASELRVGNWIYDEEGHLSKINGMKPFEHSIRCDEEEGCELLFDYIHPVHGLMKGYGCDSNECEPITLTPEILEKCGFKRTNPIYDLPTYTDYRKFNMVVNYNKDWDVVHIEYCNVNIEERTSICTLKHLHQLQNLYWCLVGEELEIKF